MASFFHITHHLNFFRSFAEKIMDAFRACYMKYKMESSYPIMRLFPAPKQTSRQSGFAVIILEIQLFPINQSNLP